MAIFANTVIEATILISCVKVKTIGEVTNTISHNDECEGAIFTQLCAVSNKSNNESKNYVQ